MTLDIKEFIRRFSLHILPHGFRKIRSYGFLANRHKKKNIHLLKLFFKLKPTISKDLEPRQLKQPVCCPNCGSNDWKTIAVILLVSNSPRSPPPKPANQINRNKI